MSHVYFRTYEDVPYVEYSKDKPFDDKGIIENYSRETLYKRLKYVIFYPLTDELQLGVIVPDGYPREDIVVDGYSINVLDIPNVTSVQFENIIRLLDH